MTNLTSIAVLITCHNRMDKTIRCLQSLFDQSVLCFELSIKVYLVDDGSTDGTSDSIRSQFPEVYIIQGNGSLYWNRGMHLAWKTAAAAKDFDYYLWLNDDTFLFDNAILEMLSYSVNSDTIISGPTKSKINNECTYGGYINESLVLPNGTFQTIHHFNGNCVLIPKRVFERVGYLDSRFQHGLGDFDYGLRAGKLGVKSLLSPNYIGTCEAHYELPVWRDSSYPLLVRLKSLYGPISACSPFDYFFFEKRHKGLFVAIIKVVLTHFRLLFPDYYKIFKKQLKYGRNRQA